MDLKASEQKEVTIVSSNVNSNRGNNFGYDRSHFSYSTNGTTSSMLTLKADSSMNNLRFYLEGGMSKLSNLIIDYSKASSGGLPNTFLQTSNINIAGSFSIRLVDTYSGQAQINVGSGAALNINAHKIHNRSIITNKGGDIIFVTQDSLNKANDALNNQASILNAIPQNIDIFMGWTTMLDRSTVMLSKTLSSNTKPISIALLKLVGRCCLGGGGDLSFMYLIEASLFSYFLSFVHVFYAFLREFLCRVF